MIMTIITIINTITSTITKIKITIDREIFAVKFFVHDLIRRKLNTRNIFCNVHQPIPILVAKVWQRNLHRLCEKFASEIFYWRKYPDLRYICNRSRVYANKTHDLISARKFVF